MTNDFDSQPTVIPIQSDRISLAEREPEFPLEAPLDPESPVVNASRNTTSPLRLVASAALSEPVHKSAPSLRHYFTAEVRRRSPDDFIMVARDPFHYLHCELSLKFEKSEEHQKTTLSLTCQFPTICDDALVDFIDGDEDLLGMILISFHMQILKNLFLFCAAHKVQNLIIKTTEDQFEGLGIYQEFIKYVDKIPAKKGMAIEMTIPVHANSLMTCDEFMDDMMAKFRKTLWKEQRTNSAIRHYLKANVRLSIVI